jgi:hypothetical protein
MNYWRSEILIPSLPRCNISFMNGRIKKPPINVKISFFGHFVQIPVDTAVYNKRYNMVFKEINIELLCISEYCVLRVNRE